MANVITAEERELIDKIQSELTILGNQTFTKETCVTFKTNLNNLLDAARALATHDLPGNFLKGFPIPLDCENIKAISKLIKILSVRLPGFARRLQHID